MVAERLSLLKVDDAQETDIPAIAELGPPESLFRDYLRLAQERSIRCLTLRSDETILGIALLVFRRPNFWPGAGDLRRLPEIVGLVVHSAHRSHGYGSAFLQAIEAETTKAGYNQIYLTVSPGDNPRAHAFFLRHSYHQSQTEPYQVVWEMTDSQGVRHCGANWLVDMMKVLSPEPQ